MAELLIRVGAVVDRNVAVAYRPMVEAAERARRATEDAARRAGGATTKETKKGTDAAEKAYAQLARQAERWKREMVRDAERAAREQAKAEERATTAAARAHERAEREKTKATETESRKREREVEREAKKAEREARRRERDAARDGARRSRELDRAFQGASQTVLRAGASVGRAAFGVGRSVVRSAGVDTDLESIFRKNIELETVANELSNQSFIQGDARNGRRVDPRELMEQAFQVGGATGMNANDALEGLGKFTAKTGDLATGREILQDMAVLSKATGASLDDMVDAAGDVAAALPDTEDKGRKVAAVMKSIAGQGKLGAVEIKDLASQMAKVAAASGQIEGDAAENIVTMGMFAQEARQRGGAASATQAATSAAALINTLKTPARAKAFQDATGKSVFNEQGMIRDPREIVLEALRAKGMNPTAFKQIFANVAGGRAVEGFATIFRQAGGGQAGEEAVRAEFERLRLAAIADAEVMESFARQMKTGQSQAEVFNNELRQSALQIQDSLTPALAQLAPAALETAKTFAQVVAWLAGDSQMPRISGMATTDVNEAITSTEKQLAGGTISEAQLKQNEIAENEAFEALNRANAEKEVRQGEGAYSSTYKQILRFADFGPSTLFSGGRIGKRQIERNAAEVAAGDKAREDEAARMRDLLDRIVRTNEETKKAIEGGIKIVSMPQAPTGITGDGVQPTPEEKTR